MEKSSRLNLRKKVFVDTNVLISGIFFSGNESILLSLIHIDLYTCDLVITELKEVIRRKLKSFGIESYRVALEEVNRALRDFKEIIENKNYKHRIKEANKLLHKKKDATILGAALAVNPDYFVTGDKDFFEKQIKHVVNVCRTKEVLNDLGIISPRQPDLPLSSQ